jgi:hypothetical protein
MITVRPRSQIDHALADWFRVTRISLGQAIEVRKRCAPTCADLELGALWRVGEQQAHEHWQVLLAESGAVLRVVGSLQRLQVHPCSTWFRSENLTDGDSELLRGRRSRERRVALDEVDVDDGHCEAANVLVNRRLRRRRSLADGRPC